MTTQKDKKIEIGTNPEKSKISQSLRNQKEIKISTDEEITWCPGCPNFLVLAAWKNALAKLIKEGYRQEDFAMVTGIGCHPKIYDYLNISGVYGLHGRVLPVCLGMKLGNPNLKVLGFSGDGDAYAEGMEHFIHAARFNGDITYFVANNQNFALTTGQPTPTSGQGFKSKAEPLGEFNMPLNPVKLAFAAGASFIARINPKDLVHSQEIIEKAIKHKGFAFVESIQDCLIFNMNSNDLVPLMYKVDNRDKKKADELTSEWDYNSKTGKIPIGIIYSEEKPILEEKWPQLKKLKEKGISWKNLK
jgi:2-oxoglutarate/2-oxoacid ferredoxin oxidoreductase subunit beta